MNMIPDSSDKMTSAQDVIIRKAVPSDMDALVRLLRELFSIEEDFAFDESLQRRGLEMMLANPDERCVMVAEMDQEVVAMGSVQLVVSTAEGGVAGLVEDVVVTKRHKGKGIGRKLLLSIDAWAGKQGIRRLQLLADKNNVSALDFYDRMKWGRTQLICLRKCLNR